MVVFNASSQMQFVVFKHIFFTTECYQRIYLSVLPLFDLPPNMLGLLSHISLTVQLLISITPSPLHDFFFVLFRPIVLAMGDMAMRFHGDRLHPCVHETGGLAVCVIKGCGFWMESSGVLLRSHYTEFSLRKNPESVSHEILIDAHAF